MPISAITPRVQGKILINQFTKLAKDKKVPVLFLTKQKKALNQELKSPKFNLNALREKIMTLSENIMLGIKK